MRFLEVKQMVDSKSGVPSEIKLKLYGLYKQATCGNAEGGPGIFGNRKKFNEWVSRRDMTTVR